MLKIFQTSIGRKTAMSLAGIGLLLFLLVHLGINLLVIFSSDLEAFNRAAHFMGTNPVIRVLEIGLFGTFIVHMVYGVIVSIQNKGARKQAYKVTKDNQSSFFSKYMFHTAAIVTIFLIIHMADFYVKAKFSNTVPEVVYDGEVYHNLGSLVLQKFKMLGYCIFYSISIILLGFHLHHGFQSAFQTLGINHKTYTPIIQSIGVIYSIVVTIGFIAIPVVIYFFK